MSKKYEETCHQNDILVHEKMFNIISCQGNANENHNVILLHTIGMAKIRNLTPPNASENEEKLDHSYIAEMTIKWVEAL